MKRKLIVLLMILFLALCSRTVMATEVTAKYTRTGGTNINNLATVITENTYVDTTLHAYTNYILPSNVKIYNHGETTEKTLTENNAEVRYSEDSGKYFLTVQQFNPEQGVLLFGEGNQYLFYTILLDNGNQKIDNVATFVYKDGITINGKTYDVKININEIRKIGGGENCKFRMLIGSRDPSDSNKYDISTYNKKFAPALGSCDIEGAKVEIDLDYSVIDKTTGKEVNFTGLFKVSDMDQAQGFAVKDFKAEARNTFVKSDFSGSDNIKYKYENNNKDTYIYSATDGGLLNSDVYLLLGERKTLDATFTFEVAAHSGITFEKDILKSYHKITTKVTGGTITDDITGIEDKENKTVEFHPDEGYVLKKVIVDGKEIEITEDMTSYTFSNITADHEIEVVYEKKEEETPSKRKYKVTFEPKNDTKIDDQYVEEGEKAVEPTKPEKDGYEFQYWYYLDENKQEKKYNFDDPVTHDIDLIAKWKDATVYPGEQLSKTGKALTIFLLMTIIALIGITIISGKNYLSLRK